MTGREKRQLFLATYLLLCFMGRAMAQTSPDFINDGDVEVRHFSSMEYPKIARTARQQGAVVLRAALDASGKVTDAAALSGKQMLVTAAVANVKQWVFAPRQTKSVIVVYLFEIDGACTGVGTFSRLGNAANIARVTTCSEPEL